MARGSSLQIDPEISRAEVKAEDNTIIIKIVQVSE